MKKSKSNLGTPEDRFDAISAHLASGDTVSHELLVTLIRDDYAPIRCEALDYIIDNDISYQFKDDITLLFDNEEELYVKGRLALCMALIDKESKGLFLNKVDIVDEVRYSMWLNLADYIVTKNTLSLLSIFIRKFDATPGISNLSDQMIIDLVKLTGEKFDDLSDIQSIVSKYSEK